MKTVKILIALTLVFGVVTLNSCKKENKEPSVAITASIDGTATTFNTGAAALTGTVQGMKVTNIQGAASNGMMLSISVLGDITAGKTYSTAADNDNDMPMVILATSNGDTEFINDDSTTNPFTLTITSVTSTSIEGTFKGALGESSINLGSDTQTGATKTVANGKFYVHIQTQP
jgi:hypothetical protein